MEKISCSIIRDVLPLYVDDVVSDETKEMVEQHLEHCEECKKEAEFMKQNVYIPLEKKVTLIQNLKKKWRNKKLIVSGLSIVLTGLFLFGAFTFVFHYDTVVPYSESLIQIESQHNDTLVSHYYGVSYYSVSATHPVSVEIDGKEKRAVFLFYTETIADSHDRKLFPREDIRDERNFMFPLVHKDDVDVIYYADFDSRKIFEEGNRWESVLEHAELIWEK